ncbi:hypothetical protein LG202_17050 [Methylobacillus methanolivorans]
MARILINGLGAFVAIKQPIKAYWSAESRAKFAQIKFISGYIETKNQGIRIFPIQNFGDISLVSLSQASAQFQ